MRKLTFLFVAVFMLVVSHAYAGVTGKIAGAVVDATTGDPLPGANIVIEGTMMGAASNLQGYYVILNVPPGTYSLKCSMIGYARVTMTDVRVKIDQTTTINFEMGTEVLAGREVTIVAERPPVEKDVAASKLTITPDQIESLPVTTVTEALGLQAGITSGLSIRGGGSDEALFMVDGVSLRDTRTNEPITQIPLSAVQDLTVQTGGLGAEYNNVRSGVVNVVTKEGDKDKYSGTISFKQSPASKKYFGTSPFDPSSYWMRSYMDPEVAWTGTKNGVWDEYEQRQYPAFEGWNAVAERTLQDDDPTNDLTPSAAQRIFMWEHRKEGDISKPDYNIDAGFGGPVPFIGKKLGDLRFFASYRREKDMYLFRLSRDGVTDQSGMIKLTGDINSSMKLSVTGIYGETYATTESRSGGTSYMDGVYDIAYYLDQSGFTVPWRLYTDIYWCPTSRFTNTISANFTHVLSPTTFYKAVVKRVGVSYHTSPGRYRDLETQYEIFPGYFVDEAPVGFYEQPIFAKGDYMGMGGAVSTSRDYSEIVSYSAKFDLESQINRHNLIRTGLEFVYDSYDMEFGMVNKALPEGNNWTTLDENPFRLTAYVQDKIEFEGFISTVGFVMDYSNPNGNWYNVGPYDASFFSQNFDPAVEDTFRTKDAKARFTVSPRLSISHPITENSKLYFNYGHYRQIVNSERLYRVQRDVIEKLDYLGDPTLPLEKTVSYELGYDHALFNDYLIHLAAYYKDIADQWYWVNYISADAKVNYSKLTSNSYQDIRGFELDISKNFGRWITGKFNYEYRVGTSGYYGFRYYYENPADQREYLRQNPKQSKPLPQPEIKTYIDFHTPENFGKEILGQQPLGGWHFNFIGRWQAGKWATWNPNRITGIEYNIQWSDYYNVDLKVSKTFQIGNMDLKFFMDIYNLFNFKNFSGNIYGGSYAGFTDIYDYDYYMKSLHLPSGITDKLEYGNIPGDDKPGHYRKTGVDFQPMEWIPDAEKFLNPKEGVIYYEAATKRYLEISENGEWLTVPNKRIDKILDDKAYIDMPNQTFLTFLNPRSLFFGLTLSYRF